MQKFQLTSPITSITFITNTIFKLQLYAPEISKNCSPGQFVQIKNPTTPEQTHCSVSTIASSRLHATSGLQIGQPQGAIPTATANCQLSTANCVGQPHYSVPTLLGRPFSIAGVNDSGVLDFLIKTVGTTTHFLSKKKVGDTLQIVGPIGSGFPELTNYKKIYIVAGGIGIAPFYLLLDKIKNYCSISDINIFLGISEITESGLIEETIKKRIDTVNILHKLAPELPDKHIQFFFSCDENPNKVQSAENTLCPPPKTTHHVPRTTHPTTPYPLSPIPYPLFSGLITDVFEKFINQQKKTNKDSSDTVVLACGPAKMLEKVHKISQSSNITCFVSMETTMACGFGVCLGCAINTQTGIKYVCKDGPVFDSRIIDWETLVC